MSVARELDLSQFADFLNREVDDLARLDFTPVLKACALLIKADVKENFQGSHDPAGLPWLPLKRRRSGRRHKGSTPKPLLDTGLLQASITAYAQGHIEDVTRDSVTVGSALDYAGWQNDGTKTIPAREFAGFSDKGIGEIEEAIGEYLERKAF
jgi:phage gpG-like protein